MRGILAGGVYSILIFFWMVISIAIIVVLYKRLSKQMLIVTGSALGSILFSMGIMGFFSGLTNVIRTVGETASLSTSGALNEGIRFAQIPFTLSTIATVLYFIIIAILIALKKQPFKRWSIWAGFFIFFLLTFVPAFYRQSMNTRLLKGIGAIMGHKETMPMQFLPLVRAGRMVVITAFALLIVYLLAAILSSIHKREKKPKAPEVAEKGGTVKAGNESETENRESGASENKTEEASKE